MYKNKKYFFLWGRGRCPWICQVQPLSQEVCGHHFDKGEKYMRNLLGYKKVFLFTKTSKVQCCIYSFYSSVLCLHLSAGSFQCPPEYREEMEKNTENSAGEQNVLPTKRGLVNLHKKVMTIFHFQCDFEGNYANMWPCCLYVCVCVSGHLCSAETQSDSCSVGYLIRRGLSSGRCG